MSNAENIPKRKSAWGIFHVLRPAFQGRLGTYGLAVGTGICGRMIGVGLPLLARHVIAAFPGSQHRVSLPGGNGLGGIIAGYAAAFAGVLLVQVACGWSEIVLATRLAQGVIASTRDRMYRHLQTLSERFFDRRAAGRVMVRFIGDANALQTWVGRTCVNVPADLVMLATVGALIGATDMYLLVCVAAPLAIVVPIMLWLNPFSRAWTRQGRREQSLLAGLLAARVESMRVVKAGNLQANDAALAIAQIDRVASANQRRAWFDGATEAVINAGSTASLGILTLCGAWLLSRSQISYGDLLLCIWLAVMSRGAVTRLARANVVHQRARVAVERIERLLQRKSEVGWGKHLKPYDGPGRRVRLKNLGYRGADGRWLLRGLTRTIRGPRLVAVSDQDGSVRSVFLELLLGLRRPHTGRVALDGVNLRKLRIDDVRRHIGWVDRDARSAVIVGTAAHSESEFNTPAARQIWTELDFLGAAGADDDCVAAPGPADLLRRCWTLSRTEQFRLALFLAMQSRPTILLLDDPTSRMAPAAVAKLVEWMQACARQRLVIVASNDPAVVAAAQTRISLVAERHFAPDVARANEVSIP